METRRLEIPGSEVFLKEGKLGYRDGVLGYSQIISEPETVGISELLNSLITRGWLCDDRDVYDPHVGTLCRKRIRKYKDMEERNIIPTYSVTSDKFISLENEELQGPNDKNYSDKDLLDAYLKELSEFTKLFNEYIMIKEDNIGEYTSIISSRDILEGTSEICLLCPKDGSYTNIINLNSIQGKPVQLRVGIAYSKGQAVFSKDLIVPTESDAESGDLYYITTGPREFKLEYSDGCIRVFPDAPEITECVISYCYLTYEHLI